MLGAADKSFLFAFADRLIDSDAAGALALIDEMMRKGREVQVFVRDVSAHLRALMLADICGEEQLSGLWRSRGRTRRNTSRRPSARRTRG